MTRKASDILIAARALIEDPGRWCTGALVDLDGRMCAVGAVCMATGGHPVRGDYPLEVDGYLVDAALVMTDGCVGSAVTINNQYGHDSTMEMFDLATSMALSDESAPAPAPEGGK